MKIEKFTAKQEGIEYTVDTIATAIKAAQQSGRFFVWGLPTGSSPIPVYAGLVHLHRQEGLSFENVITFNMDEYYPIAKEDARSFYHYTHHHLLHHVNVAAENIFYPDCGVAPGAVAGECSRYDAAIAAAGDFDMLLLGIGSNGHIAFNEPGTPFGTYTNLVNLSPQSREAAITDFGSLDTVPPQAISIGIRHVMAARQVLLTAWGSAKAGIIQQAVTGSITEAIPASCLQQHSNCSFVLDEASAALLQ
jgi:glucosamine-6-phosphate deaminase